MTESATGIVLRTRPLTESSIIVQWLTLESGRISTVAKGARRTKSPFLGKLDLFYEAGFTYMRSRRSELHTLREIRLNETHAELRQEMSWLQQAAYAANLIEQATETETPLAEVYELMRGFLGHLSQHPAQTQTIFAFELKLLNELGLNPDLESGSLKPGTKHIANLLLQDDWGALTRLKLSEPQVKELGQFLQGFIVFNLGRVPKGRAGAING